VDVNGVDTACPECGSELRGATICANCGWDSTIALVGPARRSRLESLLSGGWRALVYGALAALVIVAHLHYQESGPASTLAETLRWIALGDDGRSAELLTIHRAHEVAKATARHLVHTMQPPDFAGDWVSQLAPHATMNVRGWMPLLFVLADSQLAPAAVREFFQVRAADGWGRAYRVAIRPVAGSSGPSADPEVARDLGLGLQTSFFRWATPPLDQGAWLRLELVSAGCDGAFDTGDDLHLISYLPAEVTLRLGGAAEDARRSLEQAYVIGEHYYRVEGSRWDLIDARLLAEFRLDIFSLR